MIEIDVNDGFLYLPLKSSDFLSHYSYQRLKKHFGPKSKFQKEKGSKTRYFKKYEESKKSFCTETATYVHYCFHFDPPYSNLALC